MTTYLLQPGKYDGVKSFYNKAKVVEKDGEKILISYKTEVLKVTANGTVIRLWDGYSATTMRHVNSFLSSLGISDGGKKWWDSLPLENKGGY